MKVLIVVNAIPQDCRAGTQIYSFNLAMALSQGGITSAVCRRIRDTMLPNDTVIYEIIDGIDVYSINFIHEIETYDDFYCDKRIDKLFLDVLNTFQPDLVHINHLIDLSFGIPQVVKQKKIPLVITLHDYYLICHNIHLHKKWNICTHKSLGECAECISKSGFQANTDIALKRDRYAEEILKVVDYIISPSFFLKKTFSKFSGFKEDDIHVVRNGVNDNYENYQRKVVEIMYSEKLKVAFFGNFQEPKGILLFLESIEIVGVENIDLRLYGLVDERINAILNDRFPWWRKHYFGEYTNKSVIELMSLNADVLVVPSIIYENYPTVINEAYIAGVPVIGADLGGISEMIVDGYTGLLFAPLDSKSLAEKIKFLLKNPGKIIDMKNNLPPDSIMSFKQHYNEVCQIYEKLIGHGKLLQHKGEIIFDNSIYKKSSIALADKYIRQIRELKGELSKIYIDTGRGFSEDTVMIHYQSDYSSFYAWEISIGNLLDNDLSNQVVRVRWDPVENAYCYIDSLSITGEKDDGRVESDFLIEELNGVRTPDQIVFETPDPFIIFICPKNIVRLKISCNIKISNLNEINVLFHNLKNNNLYLQGMYNDSYNEIGLLKHTINQLSETIYRESEMYKSEISIIKKESDYLKWDNGLIGKIYFDYGNGYNESDSEYVCGVFSGENCSFSAELNFSVKKIRWDPVENWQVGIYLLDIYLETCEGERIVYSVFDVEHNGVMKIDNSLEFSTIDPSISMNVASNAKKIHISSKCLYKNRFTLERIKDNIFESRFSFSYLSDKIIDMFADIYENQNIILIIKLPLTGCLLNTIFWFPFWGRRGYIKILEIIAKKEDNTEDTILLNNVRHNGIRIGTKTILFYSKFPCVRFRNECSVNTVSLKIVFSAHFIR